MIALCSTHAALADGGRWTENQLRELKKHPFVTTENVGEYYGYLRTDVICRLGSVLVAKATYILNSYLGPVVFFRRDESGYDRLNLSIRSPEGSTVLEMVDNYWTADPRDLFDLECSARGRILRIRSKDGSTDFSMRFDDIPKEQFVSELMVAGFLKGHVEGLIGAIGGPSTVPVWTLSGMLSSAGVPLRLKPNATLIGTMTVSRSIMVRCNTGIMLERATTPT